MNRQTPGSVRSVVTGAQKMTPSEAFVETMVANGVTEMFGIMADGVDACKALAERLGAPVVNSYLHDDSFPANHPLWCGPLGCQGSKAAMKPMAQADLVVVLGSRLGPFGTLPQHGMDDWPKNAKIIQIDADNRMLGLVKKISVGICGDAKAAAMSFGNCGYAFPTIIDETHQDNSESLGNETAVLMFREHQPAFRTRYAEAKERMRAEGGCCQVRQAAFPGHHRLAWRAGGRRAIG